LTAASEQYGYSGRILFVEDDNVIVDYLGQILESRGFDVVPATTLRTALDLVDRQDFDVVVASWELAGGSDADLYKEAIDRRLELRNQFVFLASERPERFERIIRGRAFLVDPWDVEALIRAVEDAARRNRERQSAKMSRADVAELDQARPTMLLVEDGALELMAMKRVLTDFGFEVTAADCGNAAIAQLEGGEFNVILSDWYMVDGSGAELYAWVRDNQPDMVERIVFMSGASSSDFEDLAPGRTLIPKGQDSPHLLRTLMQIARGT
jgi:DNA-binding NtrC family response regulator